MNSTESRVGNWMTAREMAFLSHNLDATGMESYRSDGSVWRWSTHFSVWACVSVAS